MSTKIKQLIKEEESLFLEFKKEWYWKQNNTPEQREWGEFLKDLVSLINCNQDYIKEIKYLIIGVDETKKGIDRLNTIEIEDKKIINLSILKNKIEEKIAEYFYSEEDENYIYNNFTIEYKNIENKNILVFEIKPTKYLLILKKDLQVKDRTEKKNYVFYRELKECNTPECINASPMKIEKIKEKLNEYRKELKKEEKLKKSKEKTINLYMQKNSIFSLDNPDGEKIWKENGKTVNILYELYPVKSDFANIDFIYIYDATNQIKTYEYMKKKQILTVNAKRWVLIDNDLKKDREGIKKKFEAEKVFSLDEFALEYLYKDYLEQDIFYNGGFKKQKAIKNFIEPYTKDETDKKAFLQMYEWYETPSKPLLVVKGFGGVGKTTLVKYFLDDLYEKSKRNRNDIKILFIDSKEIINEISKNGTVKDVYDFYSAFAIKKELEKKFDKELLELSIDNGNLLIVLDGIDEVISKMSEHFDVHNFISTIYDNYSLGNERTKIIVTCRDYFWNKSQYEEFQINTISLKPFNIEMVEEFFKKYFTNTSKEYKKSLEIADEFSFFDKNEKIYLPYILEIIVDMAKQQKELNRVNKEDIDTNILSVELINDYFIGRICNREIEKLKNYNIDLQLDFFMKMAIDFNGEVTQKSHNKLLGNYAGSNSEILEKFKGHPLINYENDIFYFRYDFFQEYFTNIYISEFFKEKNKDKLNVNIKSLLTENIKFDNDFTNKVCKRNKFDDDFKIFIIDLIETQINILKSDNHNKYEEARNLISSFLCIILLSSKLTLSNNSIEDRTNLIIDIFGSNLNYLSIVNIFGQDNPEDSLVFDFRGKTILNALFENYQYFWECKFDNKTSFEKSTFKELKLRKNVTLPKLNENFFIECNTLGISDLLDKQANILNIKEEKTRNKLLKIFRHFEEAGTFKEKKIEDTRKKCDTILLDELIKQKVITPYINPSKPTLKQYKISDEYIDILDAIGQGGTNVAFEKVIKKLMD